MKPLIRLGDRSAQAADCRWLGSRLGYYLEGALGPRAMRRANDHLEECSHCQRSASLLEESLGAARGLSTIAPGADFEEAVWEKIRISREIQRQPAPWRHALTSARAAWWGGGFVAASAAAVVMFMVMSRGPVVVGDVASTAPPRGEAVSPAPSAPVTLPAETRAPALELASAPAPEMAPSAPQAGNETAPPAGPAATVASTQGMSRLEPGSQGGELYLEDIQMVPDPWSPDRGYYVVRQAVVARPGTGRISF